MKDQLKAPCMNPYGPNTDLLHSEIVIALGGQITDITPPELNMTNPKTTMNDVD